MATTTNRTVSRKAIGWTLTAVVVIIAIVVAAIVLVTRHIRQIAVQPAPAVSVTDSPLVPATTAPDDVALGAEVSKVMAAAAADPRLGDLHAIVADANTGAVLWQKDAQTLATPASSLKILTAAAVLLGLPHDKRVETSVVRYGDNPNLVLRGAGDPTLSQNGDGFYTDAASMADLATKVQQAGAATGGKGGKLYLDNLLFAETFHGKWEKAGLSDGYIAPIESVELDAGRVGDVKEENTLRSATPAKDARDVLAKALAMPTGDKLEEAIVPGAEPAVVASVQSAPLLTRVRDMMLGSDNVLAESLARELAIARGLPPTFGGAAQAVRDTLAENGFDLGAPGTPGAAVLSDSSGLSSDNRLEPAHLHAVLQAASMPVGEGRPEGAIDPKITESLRPLLDSLPVAGVSGTLASRFGQGNEGAGVARAKTGTLNDASALAGVVVTDSGKLLDYVLLSNNAQLLPARAAADKTVAELAGL